MEQNVPISDVNPGGGPERRETAQGNGPHQSGHKPLVISALAILFAALSIWFIATHAGRWKDRFIPRKFRTVEPNQIYASGQIDRHLICQVLEQNRIRTIICLVTDDPTDPDVAAELAACRNFGIERFDDPLSGDGTGDIHAYADAISQMVRAQQERKTVLVHCSSGAQRSNGATYFYRVLVQRWDADKAADEMVQNSHDPRSNPALIPYLNNHIGEMALLLQSHGIIDRVPDPLPQIRKQY